MRIPLDYYRILGVFPQATDEQLSQAYQDRRLQLPRREYSDMAIASRKQLLTQAYEILSNSEKRAAHEQSFIENTLSDELPSTSVDGSDTEVPTRFPVAKPSTLDITPEQLVGALMILQELGEYELVIKFGQSYLETLSTSLSEQAPESLLQKKTDVILTIALAAFELSRERWQQEEYEQAGIAGDKGLSILQENCLFPSLQAEIINEIYKLRPYRILELLAQPRNNREDREQGKALLQEMLQERQGIDGQGDDRSGLDIDDFLRFIQQLRTYLTASEQQELFCREAHRPSPVAAYLGVYALIGRGFAEKQPVFIVEAQTILDGLGKLQDVSLEQAICALLLGETREATLALERCQDEEVLAFIRQQSQGAPDLLPGLCLYGEYWLQTEVFSHFRNLKERADSLENYFADEAVQTYLEQLPIEAQGTILEQKQEEVTIARKVSQSNQVIQHKRSVAQGRYSRKGYSQYQEPQLLVSGGGGIPTVGHSAAIPMDSYRRNLRENSSRRGTRNRSNVTTPYRDPHQKPQTHRQLTQSPTTKEPGKGSQRLSRRRKPQKTKFKPKPWFVLVSCLTVLGMVGLSVKGIKHIMSPLAALEEDQLVLDLGQPPIEIPSTESLLKNQSGQLTPEGAKQVIETWLSSKADAFGSNYKVESLNQILAAPLLSLWKNRAENLKKYQHYWQYNHDVAIKSLKISKDNPNQATVDAKVREVADFYQNGQRNAGRSYDDQLQVRYELLRDQDRWLIRSLKLIN